MYYYIYLWNLCVHSAGNQPANKVVQLWPVRPVPPQQRFHMFLYISYVEICWHTGWNYGRGHCNKQQHHPYMSSEVRNSTLVGCGAASFTNQWWTMLMLADTKGWPYGILVSTLWGSFQLAENENRMVNDENGRTHTQTNRYRWRNGCRSHFASTYYHLDIYYSIKY